MASTIHRKHMEQREQFRTFANKVWIVAGILSLTVITFLILHSIFRLLLLILMGAIITIFFRGLSGFIERKTNMPHKWALLVSVLASFILGTLFFWLAGTRIHAQAQNLSEVLPAAIDQFQSKLNETQIGRELVKRLSDEASDEDVSRMFQSFFRSSFGVITDVYIILLVAIFFTVQPKIYTNGIVKLIPPAGKTKARQVLEKMGQSLKKWLKGQIMAMGFVFILTAIGLIILGVPLWLILALIAGLLNFIPNFGPIIALIPAVLIGIMEGTSTAIIIVIMYTVIQVLESSLITPQIQQKLLSIPPALLITVQVLMMMLSGVMGVILATPILVITMVIVNELYIKKQRKTAAAQGNQPAK